MEKPSAYLPMDRRQALLRGADLPDRQYGAALFADVSGFTPLTEALARSLGPQLGAEELTHHLNRVFDALISELHRFGGSVVGFAGDSITCWLDGDDGRRATACALAMQEAMGRFTEVLVPKGEAVSLAMKAAITVGPARRFLVGYPRVQLIDVLAGATLDELANAEHLAEKGEVILGPSAMATVGDLVKAVDWRGHVDDGEIYAVVGEMTGIYEEESWPDLPDDAFTIEQTRAWLLPAVYQRLRSGQGEFLAELRPVTTIFSCFGGIDYDGDEAAGRKLDEFVQELQSILTSYDGVLLHVSTGDKGSYFSAAFGAPVAHEDDAIRAVTAATAIASLSSTLENIDDIATGIASGRIRTGAYGGNARRTYGVMGDSVNLAARLMQAAQPGQVLATSEVCMATQEVFEWATLADIRVKGKVERVAVASLVGNRVRAAVRIHDTRYALPMVGRKRELDNINQALMRALEGQGELVGVVGEAGIGKTRLIAEAVLSARENQFNVFAGECQSYATNTSYSVWHGIWRDFFELEAGSSPEVQLEQLEQTLERIDPTLLPRMPLLGPVVNLSIPDNELTQTFDAKLRKESLEALLVDCLRMRARERPTLFVLEDCHWLDPLSDELLGVIGRTIAQLPVFFLLSYRVPEIHQVHDLQARLLPHFSEAILSDFTREEAEQLIRLKLGQLKIRGLEVTRDLITNITDRAEGNPFYIEELLNYLKGRDTELQGMTAVEELDLPTSLHTLILSRIDQLTESQKGTIKVASVIGRTFQAAMLCGAYPQLGEVEKIQSDLEELSRLDLTPLDTPEPELTYLFKNVVTQEVAYENLPLATRANIHEMIALYVESHYQETPDQYVDLLAFHYERSNNSEKRIEYLLRAGEVAQSNFANEAALSYYRRVLPLLGESQQVPVMLKLGEVLRVIGQWQDAREQYEEALDLARKRSDLHGRASSQTALGELLRFQGQYDESEVRFDRARKNFEELGDQAGIGKVLQETGTLAAQRGNIASARQLWLESLHIRRELGDGRSIAALLSNLGILARWEGDYQAARRQYEESLDIRRKLGDKWGIANSNHNLGFLELHYLDDLVSARRHLEEAVALFSEIGARRNLAMSLNELANVSLAEEDSALARAQNRESMMIFQALGDQRMIAFLLEDFSRLSAIEGDGSRSLHLYAAATALRGKIGAPLPAGDQEKLENDLADSWESLTEAERQKARESGASMSLDDAVAFALELS